MHYPNFLHILFILLFCDAEAASRASYGEKCSRELRCESRNFLSCSPTENTCVCLMPDTMTFEESSGNCVALAGERCQYTALEGERTWSDEIPCISNAACNNGMCECIPNYYEVSNGTCLQKGNFGQNCSSNSMCSLEKHLFCGPEQTCICQDNRIPNGGDCRLKAGATCNRYDGDNQCGRQSRCSSTSYGYRCTCETRYFASSTGYCEPKRSFGMPCTEGSQCDEGQLYRCDRSTKTCDCTEGYGYHRHQHGCRISPNAGDCYSDSQCVPNAQCHSEIDNKCHCKMGSNPFNGYCLVSENDPCDGDVSGDSFIGSVHITDKTCVPGLVCRDSRCSCLYKDHQIYNESGTNQKCVSLLGGPCNDTGDCARNSECLPNKAGLMECQCKEGFTQAGRHCDIAYGQRCSQGDVKSRCDRYGPLECSVKGICECSEFQIYDNATLKCRGLVGARCEERENTLTQIIGPEREHDQFCVDGATCKPFRGVKSGICACEDGKILRNDRTCVLSGNTTTTNITPSTTLRTTRRTAHDSIDESDKLRNHLPCPDDFFSCDKGGCIVQDWICDGAKDCLDGSDETEERCPCEKNETRCNATVDGDLGKCIPTEKWCDSQGKMDCPDGSDESNCPE